MRFAREAEQSYREKLLHPMWQRRRLEVMQKASFKCEKCGDDEHELNVHHRRYRKGKEPWDYPDKDLTCLCRRCHLLEHTAGAADVPTPVPTAATSLRDINGFVHIETPQQLRSLLVEAAVAVLDGRINVSQANAVVGLSAEVHKSLRQEWDMRCYVADLVISGGTLVPAAELHGEECAESCETS